VSGTEQIVTEIIVDTRGAVKGTADYDLMLRALERTAKNTSEQIQRNNAALDASGKSAKAASDILAQTSAGYRRAVEASNAYLGRIDPLIFATNALGKETEKVAVAQLGLDKRRLDGKITVEQLATGTALLTARTKELQGAMEQARAGTLSATDALTFLKTASERAAEAVKPLVVANDALRLKYDELYRVQKQYETAVNAINQGAKDQVISSTLAKQAIEQETKARDDNLAAINKRTAGPTAEDTAKQYQVLRSSIDPVYKLSKEYEAELDKLAVAQKTLNLHEDAYKNLQEDARVRFESQVNSLSKVKKGHDDLEETQVKGVASAGQMKFANQQLTVQMSQMFSGIATGQPILITLIQQGHQIADVMWASGISVKQMAASVASMAAAVPPWIYVVVTATAAITALAVSAESANLRLGRLQLSMRGLRDDFGAMAINADDAAKILAKTTTLSTDAAREITGALGKVMDFHGSRDDMIAFGKDILGLANILGETIPQATKRFTDSMELPSKGAADLIGRVKGIDEALVDQLKSMEASGKYAEAFTLLLQKERDATQGAIDPVTNLGKAHRDLMNALTGAAQATKSLFEQMGQPIITALAAVERAIAAAINKLREWNEEVAKKGGPTLGEFLLRGISPMLPGGLITSYAGAGLGGTGGRTTPDANNMVTISAPGGAQFTVRADLAPAFQGLVNELEASGYLINLNDVSSYRPGATVAGTGQPSMHAGGTAIDINASRNAVGTTGNIPPELAMALAAKYGLTWGGSFSNRDPMHFGTDMTGTQPAIDASRRILGAGQTAYDTSSVVSRQLEENQRKQEALLASIDLLQKKYNEKAAQIEDPQGAEAAMDILTKQMDQQKELLTSLRGQRTEIMSTQDAAAKAAVNANKALVGEVGAERDLNAAMERMRELGEAAGTGINEAALFRVQGAELAKLTIQFNDSITAIDLQTKAYLRLTPILEKGGQAAEFAANQEKAIEDARKTSLPNTAERARQIAAETEALNAQTLAKRDNQAATSIEKSNEQLDMLRLENSLITATTEQRNREIAVLQKRQELGLKIGDQATDEQQKALNAARAVADMTTQVQINQQAIQELGNLGTQVFDQVGNAITQAFVGGQGAAVNFGNVARAVMTSVLQEVLKLAVLNPILNATVGGANRTTLDQVIGALGGASGGGSGEQKSAGADLMSLASSGSSVVSGGSSILQAFGYQGLGGQINALFGGPGTSLLAGVGGANGPLAGITAFLNTPLYGGTGAGLAGGFASDAAVTGGAAAGGFAPATTLGSLLGGFGGGIAGGFALGSLGGGLIQSSLDKVGPAPMIGAGTGALLGAGAGFVLSGFNPIGALIGGLLGGTAGGVGGGFIGPHAPSTYSATQIFADDQGRLSIGKSVNQGTASNRDATNDAVTALNAFTAATNIAVTSLGGITQLGVGTGDSKAANLEAAFPRLRFTSTDQTLADNIANRSFATSQELQDAVNRILAMEQALKDFTAVVKDTDAAKEVDRWAARFGALGLTAADYAATLTNIATFVTQTVPTLLSMNTNIGSLQAGIKGLNDQFASALVTARDLGYKETELTAARDLAIKTLKDAAAAQYANIATGLVNRAVDAANKLSGASPAVLRVQALTEFDQQATAQRLALVNQLKGIFGDSYESNKDFANLMALEDAALYQERLLVAKQFDDAILAQDQAAADKRAADAKAAEDARLQAAGTAAQAIASLSQYAFGLQTSAASPLNAQDQLALARSQFNAVSGAAAAGDINSIQQLQQYADTFINASRVVYGSGAAYVSDFQRVLDALNSVASVSPDTLTASVLQVETRTQTATLVQSLADLKAAVDAVTSQLRQNQSAPSRIAA
jgi:hypothetical protein